MTTAAKALLFAISFRILLDTAPGLQPDWDYDYDEWALKLKQQELLKSQSQLQQHVSSSVDRGNNNVEIVRFLGGDGSTELVGHLYRPPSHSNSEEGDDDSASSTSTTSRVPVIVLGHGLGLSQDCGLSPFVDAFTDAGFAAFTFDYATFGASGGLPRHVVHPNNHVADIEAAIQMIRDRGSGSGSAEGIRTIDANRIGLWGTSLGGGHALVVAANHARNNEKNKNDKYDKYDEDEVVVVEGDYLKAVVALVPHVASAAETVARNFDFSNNSVVGLLKITHAMIKWASVSIWSKIIISSTTNANVNNDDGSSSSEESSSSSSVSSWYVPLHGVPGSAAFMQNPGDDEGYSTLIPSGNSNIYGWKNAATAISAVRMFLYRPMNTLHSLARQNNNNNNDDEAAAAAATITPILMIAAEKDTLCPLEFIQRAFELISSSSSSSSKTTSESESESVEKRKLVVLKDVGHFDVYKDNDERKLLQQVLTTTVEFFAKHL